MIRVLHVVGRMDRAGAETMIMNLYRAIDRSEVQFDFLYFTEETCDFDTEIIALGGRIFRLPVDLYSNPLSRMFALRRVLLENTEITAVHCHTNLSNLFHIAAAKYAGVGIRIAHSHNTDDRERSPLVNWLYRSVAIAGIRLFATHLFTCGKAAADYLFPGIKGVTILPNALDVREYAAVAELQPDFLECQYGLSENCLKLIQVGRFHEVKNHAYTLEIASELVAQKINFKLFFVGTGHTIDDIRALTVTKGLAAHVEFMGVRANVPEIMASANVMLMPSLHEGFPVVLVEAQAVGLPSVIADTISPEVDLDVGLIHFCALDADIGSWVAAIQQAIAAQRLPHALRSACLAGAGFDVNFNAQNMMQVYRNGRGSA